MPRVTIKDLDEEKEITGEEMKAVLGGSIGRVAAQEPARFRPGKRARNPAGDVPDGTEFQSGRGGHGRGPGGRWMPVDKRK